MIICRRCIYDESMPEIFFDKSGICNYCLDHDNLIKKYGTKSNVGFKNLKKIVKEIKYSGRNNKYDCTIGVSGGTDSSYLIFLAKKMGLRPLAVHYDNTWNTEIATENIRKVLSYNNVDLFTYVVNNKEADDIFRSFLLSGVPEIDCSTDLALAEVNYMAAKKYNIKYALDGHSFTTEGITPISKNYFDGKYIRSIHKEFGNIKMNTYPLMTLTKFMKYILYNKIKRIKPLWYIDYSKEKAQLFLEKKCGWKNYGGHHLENRMSSFAHQYYLPKKFNLDLRLNPLSANVRAGRITRQEALEEYQKNILYDQDNLDYLIKRLGFSHNEFLSLMNSKPKYWYNYPNYKKTFETLEPLFKILLKKNYINEAFYKKYALRNND